MIQVGPNFFRNLKSNLSKNKENVALKNDNFNDLCFICFDKEPNSIYKPCGHGGVCKDCVLGLNKSVKVGAKAKCPFCRKETDHCLIYKKVESKNKTELLQIDKIDFK